MKSFIQTITIRSLFSAASARRGIHEVIQFGWDMKNNCGPRPSDLLYPEPPFNATGVPGDAIDCDIIQGDLYIADYQCTATCRSDSNTKVTLFCDCHFRSGPINVVKQCEWNYWNGQVCPAGRTTTEPQEFRSLADIDPEIFDPGYPMANDYYAYTAYIDQEYPEISEVDVDKKQKKSKKSERTKKSKDKDTRLNQIEGSSLFAELPNEAPTTRDNRDMKKAVRSFRSRLDRLLEFISKDLLPKVN